MADLQYRTIELELARSSGDQRTAEASLSSETPAATPNGTEILDHSPGAVDMKTLVGPQKGGVPWWKAEAIAKRDAALRELYQRFHSDAAPWRAAGEIERQTKIYETGRWRRDKDRNEMPATYIGHVQEYLWRAFKSGAQMPVAQRRLLDILS